MARPDPDRRRFLIATIVTLVALPALWWINRDDDSGAPSVASVGVDVGSAAAASTDDPARDVDDPALSEPVFLDGPSSPVGGVADIAVPAPPERVPLTGSGTYSSVVSAIDKCFAKGVTTGSRITVVNLDNNRSVECIATLAPEAQPTDVVMHTKAYLTLADLTDAPIPVEIRR